MGYRVIWLLVLQQGDDNRKSQSEDEGRRSQGGTPSRIGCRPMVESRERRAMVEAWPPEPGGQWTETELLVVENQEEMKT